MRTRASLLNSASRPNFDGIRLSIEYVSPELITAPRRALKKLSKDYIKRVAAGIERNGFVTPIMVDEQLGQISICGRLEAAKLLGLTEIPVVRISHLNDEQIELMRIFESKIAEGNTWDLEALNLTFEEIRFTDPDIDLTDSGFTIGEIDENAGRIRTAALNDLDDVHEPDPKAPVVSRLGDLWRCDSHHVFHGNSLDHAAIDTLVGDAPIHLHLSDCPYNMPTRDISSSGKHQNFVAGSGEMTQDEFARFLRSYLLAALPHLADGALVYAFMDWRHLFELTVAAEAAGLSQKQLLVWVKGQSGMGSFYRSGHELIGVFKHGKGPSRNNIQLGAYGRNRSNVLSYPGVMGSRGRKKALAMHPTVKNVALIADLILDATAPGDNVLDSFGGSGTTLIAAEKTGRRAFVCELSPAYVDVILTRYEALGGPPVTLASTGQTFAEVRAERSTPRQETAA